MSYQNGIALFMDGDLLAFIDEDKEILRIYDVSKGKIQEVTLSMEMLEKINEMVDRV